MTQKPFVLCIIGPTACHKTEVSIQLAKQLNGEIVSADSVAVYRRLDIGSAKPTIEEQQAVPHHMIDVADITDTDYSVARFCQQARDAIESILSCGKLPIVVGGSGLYSDAIFSEMRFCAPSDPAIRSRLEKEYRTDADVLYDRLRRLDAVTAERLHRNDAKRIIRALEVYEVSGKPFSEWNEAFVKAQEEGERYRVFRCGLDMDRAKLYERINLRVDRMFENGLKQEAFSLFDEGLSPRYPALQAIGYAQLYEAYRGAVTLEEAKEQIKLATRHFAKRQLTWFRRNKQTKWYFTDQFESMDACIRAIEQDVKANAE